MRPSSARHDAQPGQEHGLQVAADGGAAAGPRSTSPRGVSATLSPAGEGARRGAAGRAARRGRGPARGDRASVDGTMPARGARHVAQGLACAKIVSATAERALEVDAGRGHDVVARAAHRRRALALGERRDEYAVPRPAAARTASRRPPRMVWSMASAQRAVVGGR
ncbi:MAG: hypothetical protein HS111_23410 [Kofleriaceae bacterium]|nr:hypothetical protein [Kofleriaceae bacterium]